jgi:hypothetical protein
MALGSEYKTADLEMLEQSSGNGEKRDSPPVGLHTDSHDGPHGLEVCILRILHASYGLDTWLTSILEVHQPSCCSEFWSYYSRLMGVVWCYLTIFS